MVTDFSEFKKKLLHWITWRDNCKHPQAFYLALVIRSRFPCRLLENVGWWEKVFIVHFWSDLLIAVLIRFSTCNVSRELSKYVLLFTQGNPETTWFHVGLKHVSVWQCVCVCALARARVHVCKKWWQFFYESPWVLCTNDILWWMYTAEYQTDLKSVHFLTLNYTYCFVYCTAILGTIWVNNNYVCVSVSVHAYEQINYMQFAGVMY